MRSIYLLIFILGSVSLRAQTSVYHPFPDSAAVWNFDSYQGCGQGFDVWEHVYSITFSGDTIINTIKYHKLNFPVEIIIASGGCGYAGTGIKLGDYLGCVRQDSSNRKVFFVPPAQSMEQLLYDFNMIIGDTVKGYISNTDIVETIDSVLIGNTYRKRWNMGSFYNVHFIEGIGSTYGLIQQSPGYQTDGPSFSLTCFQQNGKSLYSDTTTNCQLITSINKTVKKPSQITVFPNPTNDDIILNLDALLLNQRMEYEVHDIVGQLVDKGKMAKETININLPEQTGIYFLKIFNEGNSKQIKLIKN